MRLRFEDGTSEYDRPGSRTSLRAVCARGSRVAPVKPRALFVCSDGGSTVLERMKNLRASGMGFDSIAATLNAEGLHLRRDERSWRLTVNGILPTARRS